jgi:hypothetical protein
MHNKACPTKKSDRKVGLKTGFHLWMYLFLML